MNEERLISACRHAGFILSMLYLEIEPTFIDN